MRIKEIQAKNIKDSRGEDTISIAVRSENGSFMTSAPGGKSKGKYEVPAFPKSVKRSIELLKKHVEKLKELRIEEFSELAKIENLIDKKEIGANTLYALEASILKALAFEQRKELWEFLAGKGLGSKKIPFPIGNVIEGGLHATLTKGKKPDFQEFLIIPKLGKFSENVQIMKKAYEIIGEKLRREKAIGKLSDENAWSTSLSNEQCLEILNETRNKIVNEIGETIETGIDIAASSFYSGLYDNGVYDYKNPEKFISENEQLNYLAELIEKFDIFYVEDPFDEDDFKTFRMLREKLSGTGRLVVGDDLTVSNTDRFVKALKEKSIDAIILKPNQTGSLLEIKKLIEIAKKYDIATVMSHRSGETTDSTIADLAVAWQTDFIKTGIIGEEREAKLKRLIAIEKSS